MSSRVSTSETEEEYPITPFTVIAAKSNTSVTRKTSAQGTSQPTQQITTVESLADFANFMASVSTLEIKYDLLKQHVAIEKQKRHRLQISESSFYSVIIVIVKEV